MILAVLSDIHANMPALERVLDVCAEHDPDMYLVAGDLVGYNPFPGDVVDAVLQLRKRHIISGNHDRAVLSDHGLEWFVSDAKDVILWTRERLSGEQMAYLSRLRERVRLRLDGVHILLCHGSPRDPDEYVYARDVDDGFLTQNRVDILILGHTHIPFARRFSSGLIMNPGSVGQPRDGNPAASFSLLDTETLDVENLRVDYDIDRTADAILQVGLPERFARRLYMGV